MSQLRILIVDDETDVRNLLCEFLTERGYQCRQAPDAEEAQEFLTEFAPNLIITDINMPVQSGIELLRAATENHPGVKVIIMTGGADLENAIDAVNFGAAGFFRKPLELEEILNAIKRIAAEIQQGFKANFERKDLLKENTRLRNSNAVLKHFQEQFHQM